MKETEPHNFKSGKIFLIQEDVLHIVYDKGVTLEVSDIMAVRDFRLKHIGEQSFYSILDMSLGVIRASNDAKAWMAVNKESSEFRILDVFIVKNLITRLKVNLYLKMYKPSTETLIVFSMEDALDTIAARKRSFQEKSA